MANNPGVFISFEGGECTGKTTQAELLRNQLLESGYRCILVYEPGGTALGERLRHLIKGELSISYGAELFLFSAARAELVSKVIKPALDSGNIVITDRYVDSTTVYQGYGRRLDLDQIKAINIFSTQGIMPGLTVLLDMAPEEALKRLASLQIKLALDCGGGTGGRPDREGQRKFEEEDLEFHRRVRQGYLTLAKREPKRWIVVDAGQTPETVREIVWKKVRPLLSRGR